MHNYDAKTQILIDTFENRFDTGQFEKFIVNFFNSVEWIRKKHILTDYDDGKKFILEYTHIANYNVDIKTRVAIFSIKLKDGSDLEKARTVQRNFAAKLLRGSNGRFDTAIAAFYADNESRWRLSFVKLDYDYIAGKEKEYVTPAKRYSYLVGKGEPCHTAQERMLPIFKAEDFNPSIKAIEEAFSVETITIQFFKEYEDKYTELYKLLDNNPIFLTEAKRCDFTTEQFAKKLLGQLSFLYFLQKKGWLGITVVPSPRTLLSQKEYDNAFYKLREISKTIVPKVFNPVQEGYMLDYNKLQNLSNNEADLLYKCFKVPADNSIKYKKQKWGEGNKRFVRTLFDKCKELNGNFYDEYLEPLFYEALNSNNRGENFYYKRFNCRMPFLNGGLFMPLKKYNWEYEKFDISNDYFSNNNRNGILDMFDRYNFTMCEDEPLEREVAVDPEMLGKFFENLLDTTDRKSKGAFYTPREIVHFICSESLINYLANETAIPYEDIRNFVLFGDNMKMSRKPIPESIRLNMQRIEDALINIKVADPAVGSGAFPLGMLSEIVKIRHSLTPLLVENKLPINKNMSEGQINQINALRATEYDRRNLYDLKLQTIQNSIFAVDIEASAVDIAKLRLWLSLVVDENLDPIYEERQRGVTTQADPRPLPNLDYNIMCGNSLIDEFEGIKLYKDSIISEEKSSESVQPTLSVFKTAVDELLEDLFEKQKQLFTEIDEEKKVKLINAIEKDIDDIIRTKLSMDNNSVGLARYEESLKQKTRPYFLWKLYFGKVFRENGGFDIVIGNPPYVQLQKDGGLLADQLQKKGYIVFERTGDIYCLFYEQGNNLLCNGGHLCFITSNKWMRAGYGRSLRKYLAEKTQPKLLIDLGAGVFDAATVDTNILLFKKGKQDNIMKACSYYDKNINLSNFVDKNSIKIEIPQNGESFIILSKSSQTIKEKIEKAGIPLKDWGVSINRGILTGYNEAFIIDSATKEALVEDDPESIEIFKPILRGKDINRYNANWAGLWLINTHNGIREKNIPPVDVNNYPAVKKHLDKYYHQLEVRADKGITPYNLRNCAYLEDFEKDKIIFQEMVQEPMFCVDLHNNYFCLDTGRIIITDKIEYLSAFLNSKLFFYAMKKYYGGGGLGDTGIRMKHTFFQYCPVVVPDEIIAGKIENLVENIITLKNQNPQSDISALEKEIDRMIYELYDLSDEEIKIVEDA